MQLSLDNPVSSITLWFYCRLENVLRDVICSNFMDSFLANTNIYVFHSFDLSFVLDLNFSTSDHNKIVSQLFAFILILYIEFALFRIVYKIV